MKPRPSIHEMHGLIHAARGLTPCDLAIRGGYVVNVFTGELVQADIGVVGGYIAVVTASDGQLRARTEMDAQGLFLAPGLIDAHMHLESSMLSPAEFTRAALPRGTTAVVMDPHEIANVAGRQGIAELVKASEGLPLTFYVTVSPAVPESDLVTSGGELTAEDIVELSGRDRVVGIAEAMDFPAVIDAREDMLEKLTAMPGRPIDGHAPGLSGRDLQSYAAAGVTSEHEATNAWEGMEKLRAGMYLMIREGSAARDLDDLIRLVTPATLDRCLLITDDLSADDLLANGHVDHLLRRAVGRGVSAAQAVRMVTLNAAQRFRLDRVGAIAPGCAADLVAFEDLSSFGAAFVIAKGELVAVDGELVVPVREHRFSDMLTHTVRLPDLTPDSIAISSDVGPARVIRAADGQLITRQLLADPAVLSGKVVPDVERDLLKIVVVERHGRNGNVGVGLANGFALTSGAIAGSVAHDAHNVVAVGTNDHDILLAIRRIGQMDGGLVAVRESEVIAELPLPVAGLISTLPAQVTADRLRRLDEAARQLGCGMRQPFMTLSFMCLSVIPELKLTDKGLVDTAESRIVPIFTGDKTEFGRAASG